MGTSHDAWQIDPSDFSALEDRDAQLRFLLRYAVLAPSGHNTQPWLFRIRQGGVEVRADRTRGLPVVDPDDRELLISCGAALYTLVVAARHFGFQSDVQRLPDPDDKDLVALVRLGPATGPAREEDPEFSAIDRRSTDRSAYSERDLAPAVVRELQGAADRWGAWFEPLAGEDRQVAASLVAQGDRIQMADPSFRRELAQWVHPNRTRSRDGMPGYAFGMGDLMSLLGPLVIRTFDMGDGQAAKDQELALNSPVLAVLGTVDDSADAWVRTGCALQKLLLTAEAHGLSASHLNQPVELPDLRDRLQDLLSSPGHPQILLRLGYGTEEPTHVPRRPVDEVLL